jgi:RNA polymerase sigma factor FliA
MYNAKGKLEHNEMIVQNLPLVRKEALILKMKLPGNVDVDDLMQSGAIGLMDAVKRYDPSIGIKFDAYAKTRIRGAMIDEMRKNDWAPRRIRSESRRVDKAITVLSQRFKRPPEEREIAQYLEMNMEEYGKLLNEINSSHILYTEILGPDLVDRDAAGHHQSPLNELLEGLDRLLIVDAINALPEKEKQTLALYYQEKMNLKEIGAVFGVSESRVCQIHSQAIARMRVALKND